MLVTRIFSFSEVFNRLLSQSHLLVPRIFYWSHNVFCPSKSKFLCFHICNSIFPSLVTYSTLLKVALQILGRKFYKNTKKSSLYSQSLLIFIHRIPVVKRHPITREIRDLLWPMSTPK